MEHYFSRGKLLISGEYAVLDGALAWAVPTKLGQSMAISEEAMPGELEWISLDNEENIWFQGRFSVGQDFKIISYEGDISVAERLQSLFNGVRKQNEDFFPGGKSVATHLHFPSNWGLGSSSTLLHLISQWTHVDPYKLLENTFGGSGYDIAAGSSRGGFTYRLANGEREINEISWAPDFMNHLYFVFLGEKQDSRAGIRAWRERNSENVLPVKLISGLTRSFISCQTLTDFQSLIQEHENIISIELNLEPIKEKRFPDFEGAVKSLGAWGGDFVLVASSESEEYIRNYFSSKNLNTVIAWKEMIWQDPH
jgi:hypothetical protein